MSNKNYGFGFIAFIMMAYLLLTMIKDRLFNTKEYEIRLPQDLDRTK